MTLTRRALLSSAAAALALAPTRSRASEPISLNAQPGRQQLAPDGYPETPIWGYEGKAPGPVIRVPRGVRVRRRLQNNLPQATTVHWHGIRIDNAMDGVPGLTQAAVESGAGFDYDFLVPDAGTFWYHSHNRSMEQVAHGLYGALVVEEETPPDVDRDLVLILDDWRLDPETAALTANFDNFHDLSHAGRIGNIVTVNGRFDPEIPVRRHERLRLRLINAANARVFELGLAGLEGWIVALDGMPLETPLAVTGAFTLSPAQRADLVVDVISEPGASADLLSVERDGGWGLVRLPVEGTAAENRRDMPLALPPNILPKIENTAASPLSTMVMTGGAMRWLEQATLGQTLLDGRELAKLGKFWALNGIVDRPDAPFIDAQQGETHRIALVNDTAFAHAMHLHGHHFRAIAPNGTLGPWRDTLLVQPGETRQIALVTDNPGNWLMHCHMLGHAAAGMTSWFRVAA